MPSQGYNDWIKAGKPYTLIRPAAALVRNVAHHGITVYHYPDTSHLRANTPEDHTPFSVTGWPGSNARWMARGVDIMPRSDTTAGRKENANLARQLISDRNAGLPGATWIKYINWTDENGVCRQERWTPSHTTRSSGDKGHIHVSGRSDVDTYAKADDYDPVLRMQISAGLPSGGTVTTLDSPIPAGYPYAGDPQWTAAVYAKSAAETVQKEVHTVVVPKLDQLLTRPSGGTVTLTPEDRQAIIDGVTDGVLDVLATKLGPLLVQAMLEIDYTPIHATPPPTTP